MNAISVNDPVSGRSYRADRQVYETENVWCGAGRDPEYGDILVKLLRYDPRMGNARQICGAARQEAETMLRVARCTAGVPKLYAHWDDRKNNAYVLVMQKMPGVTLRQWLKKRTPVRQDEKTLWLHSLILRQVAQILLEIHNKIPSISHRDLKPENVMIWLDQEKRWQVAIIDFGTAALNYSVQVGTYGYQPPEQVTLEGAIMGTGEAKDVFALGMMWHELLTGIPASQLYGQFRKENGQPQWASRPTLPPQLRTLEGGERCGRMIEKMTAYDPAKRPTLRDVVHSIQRRRQHR